MLAKWSGQIIKARLLIASLWITATGFGLFGAMNLDQYLTTSVEVPGSQSAVANEVLKDAFKENTEGTFAIIYKFKNASDSEIELFKSKISQAASIIPGAEVLQQRALGGSLYASVGTPYDLKEAGTFTEALRQELKENGLDSALVSGPPAIENDVLPILGSDLRRGQVIAVVAGFALLVLTLGFSWSVLIPLLFGLATISTSLGIIYLMAQKFLMVLYIPNIVELVGLGLAIDYSLLMVHRYRRESENAIEKTMQTAGRTVVISGLTVSMGLATLFLVPVPFVRSLGLAGVIVPLVSIAAAITLQPILLKAFGASPSKGFKGLLGGSFEGVANFAIAKPKRVFAASALILTLLMSSLLWLQVTPSSLTAIPSTIESGRALKNVTDKVGVGIITPSEIVFDLGNDFDPVKISEIRFELAKKLSKNPEVFTVAAGDKWPYVNPSGRYMRMYVFGQHDLGAPETTNLVRELREKYIPEAEFPNGTKIYLGGAPAQGVDLLNAIAQSFPWIVVLVLLITFLLLLRAFSSVVLALKAIILDLISVAVAFAVLVIIFKFGVGSSLLGTYRLDQLEAWVLVFLFAMLFGLSMDYELFIVSRMREAWDRGASNEEAIREGMRNSGSVVTAAAIIFISALAGLVTGHFAGLQQLGIGLAAGILIDATVIRGLLLPSAMVLLGKWNWWLPEKLHFVNKGKTPPLN